MSDQTQYAWGKSGSMYQNITFNNIIDSTFCESKEENKNLKGPSDSRRPVTRRLQTQSWLSHSLKN